MQAPSRDRRGDHGGSVTPMRRPVAVLFALALVRQRNPRLLAHAIVAVGLAVAAADHELWSGDLWAELGFRAQVPEMSAMKHCPGFL